MITKTTLNSLRNQSSLFGFWLPKSLLLLTLVLLSLTPVCATVHTIGTGGGGLSVTSMSSLSLVSGDTISIAKGTYNGGTFINLNNITVVPASGGVTFTGSINIGNDSVVSFDGTVLSGVTYGYTFSTTNAAAGAFIPYTTEWDLPDVGNTLNCSIKGVQLLDTAGPVLNGVGSGITYTGTPATCLYYNMTLDTILETGSSILYNGQYEMSPLFDDVNIGMTMRNIICINGSATCIPSKVQGRSIFGLVADNWTVVGATDDAGGTPNPGDTGIFDIWGGNCILKNIYRNGGFGWLMRLRELSLGTPATTYVYNCVDVNNTGYGTIDTEVDADDVNPTASIPTVGSDIVIANVTSGNHLNDTGYTSDLCICYGNTDGQTPATIYTTSIINCLAFNNPGSPGTSLYTPEVATNLMTIVKTNNIDIIGALPAGYITDTNKFYPASGSTLVAGGTTESFDPTDIYGASRGSSNDIGAVQHDITAPTIAITAPTSSGSYSTNASTLNMSGTASDNDYVSSVTWTDNLGGSGSGSTTTTWSGSGVPVSSTTWSITGLTIYNGTNVITVTAHDPYGNTNTAVLSVANSGGSSNAPSISGTAPGGTVGTAYHFTYTTTGSPSPTSSKTAGTLPAGLSLSTAGVISGTPTTAATYTGTITATNGVGSPATDNFSIVVAPAPTAPSISGTASSGTTGTAYSFTYTVAGNPSPTCSVSAGTLPAGLSLSTAGVISGTPTTAATYTGTITATNGVGSPATDNFSIVVTTVTGPSSAAINCGSSSTYTAGDGTVYSADTYFTGGTAFTATTTITTGSDPTLYAFYRYGSPTPAVYNIPMANGTYTVHLKYAEMTPTNGVGSRVFGVTIQGTTVESAFDIRAHVAVLTPLDEPYTAVVTNGTLSVGQIYISGNPLFSAINVVSPAPTITNGPPPSTGTSGTAYHFTYTTSGTPTPTFNVSAGSLPTGLTLSTAGVISGTPTASGTFTGTARASNTAGAATQNFSIVISVAVVKAINCGSASNYTAGDGTVYLADTYFSGGSTFTATTTITSGSDPSLYTYYRYGSPTPAIYSIPISNGTYVVHLKYAEMDPTKGVGSRIFGVTVQGTTVESAFDIRAHVAALTALDEPYTAIVTTGTLNVGQIYITGNPEFSAIKVTTP